MKIEICEQMAQSWLQHIQKCQIVQTNWAISPLKLDHYTSTQQYKDAKAFIDEIQKALATHNFGTFLDADEFHQDLRNELLEDYWNDSTETPEDADDSGCEQFLGSFGDLMHFAAKKKDDGSWIRDIAVLTKNKDPFKTFIKQCEIDVVGIKLDDGKVKDIYLMDTAFHAAGLNYSGKTRTEARVTKKLIKFIAVADIVFGVNVPIHIIFAAPVCKDTPYKRLDYITQNIIRPCAGNRPALGGKPTNITVDLYCNHLFANEIYAHLKQHLDALNNDNELFMRALNLTHAAENALKKGGSAGSKAAPAKAPGAAPASGAAKASGKRSLDEKLEIAAYYLTHDISLPELERIKLPTNADGTPAKSFSGSRVSAILKSLGIITSDPGGHKGLLLPPGSNIDDEIKKASGEFKNTLEEIKNRGLC